MRYIFPLILAALSLMPVTLAKDGNGRASRKSVKLETATFAGGCFWCMQPPFDKLKGVVSSTVGYTGGKTLNPTYKQVCSGRTGHTEAIQIKFDPTKITYAELLKTFWKSFDPTDNKGQFADRGTQYRPEIFYHSKKQKAEAEASKKELTKSKKFRKPITTAITKASIYYPAEAYHQKYYLKKTDHYKRYRKASGREGFLKKYWGKS